jgi:hypothetical protein
LSRNPIPLPTPRPCAEDRRSEDQKFPIGGPAKDDVPAIASPIGLHTYAGWNQLERSLLPLTARLWYRSIEHAVDQCAKVE